MKGAKEKYNVTFQQALIIEQLVNYKQRPAHHPLFQMPTNKKERPLRKDGWLILSDFPKKLHSNFSKLIKPLAQEGIVLTKTFSYWDDRQRLATLKAYKLLRSEHAVRRVIIALENYDIRIFLNSNYGEDCFKTWFKFYNEFYALLTESSNFIKKQSDKFKKILGGKPYPYHDSVSRGELWNDVFTMSKLFVFYLGDAKRFKILVADYNKLLALGGINEPRLRKEFIKLVVQSASYLERSARGRLPDIDREDYVNTIPLALKSISFSFNVHFGRQFMLHQVTKRPKAANRRASHMGETASKAG